MDPNQIPPPPDGSGVVSTGNIPPPPDGSGIVSAQPSTQGGSITPSDIPDSLQIHPDDDPIMKGLKGVNSVGAGVGSGILDTLSGGLGIENKIASHLPSSVSNLLLGNQADRDQAVHLLDTKNQELQHQNSENPTLGAIGKGTESVAEFLLGDEALKGLTEAEKYAHVAKTLKLAEKSPNMMKALKVGADAARMGVVQGAQTAVKTGGDLGAAAESGLAGAATAGVLGGTGAIASNLLGKGAKAAATIAEMTNAAQDAPSHAAVNEQLSNATKDVFKNETGSLQNNLDDAASMVGMFGEGAPQLPAITKAAKDFADAGKKTVHGAYQTGFEQLQKMAGDTTIPYENSPLHQAAKGLAAEGEANAGALDKALDVGRPGSDKANRVIDNLATFGKEPEEEQTGGAHSLLNEFIPQDEDATSAGKDGEEPVPASIGMRHLVEYRQKLARLLRDVPPNTEYTNADKDVYRKLIKGTDNTIGQLADGVGKITDVGEDGEPLPSKGRQFFDSMNEAYHQGIQPFQNRDVKNILKGNLDNVAKSIMGGQTSLDDITSVKKALGPQNFAKVSQASLQNIVQSFADSDTGEVDYKKLFQRFNKIDPNVRTAMFGDQGSALATALKVANQSEAGMGEIGKKITGLLGSGDIDTVLKSPEQAQQLSSAIGPEGMKTLGQSVMQNKIAEASTVLDPKTGQIVKSNFDPDKVLDWWMSMKNTPEVRDAFFSVDKDSAKQYDQLMSRLAQASSVKKLVKYGVLPVTLGTAGLVHGPLGALTGALAGLGTEAGFGRARDILDTVANNPKTWAVLRGIGNAANSETAQTLGQATQKVATNAAGRATEPNKPTIQDKVVEPADDRGAKEVKLPTVSDTSFDSGPMAGNPIQGLVQKGNIDVNHRPGITNADGSHSSIFSMTVPVNKDGSVFTGKYEDAPQYALVPSIANGKFLTPDGKKPNERNRKQMSQLEDAATNYYAKTRQHLGIFSSGDAADKYAGKTHAYMNDGTDKKVYAPSYDPSPEMK